jgi:hypothetical protein
MGFFNHKKENTCKACLVYESQVEYLKEQVERLSRERETERAEYKRAIDALLIQHKIPAIGQGYTEAGEKLDPTKLFAFFEEETKDIGGEEGK